MIQFDKQQLKSLDKIFRLNLINSITGVRPVNLIGTVNSKDLSNLAVFSSVTHLGSHPALFGIVTRPTEEVPRHTYRNIHETGYFTINQVHSDLASQAHQTSAKYSEDESEFEKCGFTEQWLNDFKAPYVKQCHLKFGLKFIEEIKIKQNNTRLLIGEIEHLYINKQAVDDQGYINVEKLKTLGVIGLNNYYDLSHNSTQPYARPAD